MFKVVWDKQTGGVTLQSHFTPDTLSVSPRPVFYEELNMLGINKQGWEYPSCEAPLMWACNKQYFYRGELVFEVRGANLYDNPIISFSPSCEKMSFVPVDMEAMLQKVNDNMFLIESEAIEFIRDQYTKYSEASKKVDEIKANQIDFEKIVKAQEKASKKKMAIVKQDCDSFDIMSEDEASSQGKKTYLTTKIDKYLASFSGGKDSQVVLDLCTRAIPPQAFEVIYSNTGYEIPTSIKLYKEIEAYYHGLYPDLKFSTAQNHREVVDYWDMIGTPSDTHRWCCTIMKTAPLYRLLKIDNSNKQAKVLTFEGVRAEESTRRSGYERIGRGVKHDIAINARPILSWNTTEVFLYLFRHNLPINIAYRRGMTRVGCLICPFSSEWNEHIAQRYYPENLEPFTSRLNKVAKAAGVQDVNVYIKEGNWKRRASGDLIENPVQISFRQSNTDFIADVINAKDDLRKWLFTVGEYKPSQDENKYFGEIRFNKEIFKFELELKKDSYRFVLKNTQNGELIGLIKRVIYKAAYCINCEVCEVECPTGALSVYPEVKIDRKKCIHCHKCLLFHEKGCVVANSLAKTKGNNNNMQAQTSIDRYKNFGLREDWVDMYFAECNNFWSGNHGLNPTYQIPSLRNWLKDAEIIDGQGRMTETGEIIKAIYDIDSTIAWEIIWINLTYNSFIAKWFASRIGFNVPYSKAFIEEGILNEFPVYKGKTVQNAAYQILRTLKESPIGSELMQYNPIDKTSAYRNSHERISPEAVAYSIYRYAKERNITMLRISEFYRPEVESGVYKEFGTSKATFEKRLRTLNSASNRLLEATLNMGLDHITLREDITPLDVLKSIIK